MGPNSLIAYCFACRREHDIVMCGHEVTSYRVTNALVTRDDVLWELIAEIIPDSNSVLRMKD